MQFLSLGCCKYYPHFTDGNIEKLSQKGSFLSASVPTKMSSKHKIRTQNIQEADSECILPQHADLI